jgi:hypothetical protein
MSKLILAAVLKGRGFEARRNAKHDQQRLQPPRYAAR